MFPPNKNEEANGGMSIHFGANDKALENGSASNKNSNNNGNYN